MTCLCLGVNKTDQTLSPLYVTFQLFLVAIKCWSVGNKYMSENAAQGSIYPLSLQASPRSGTCTMTSSSLISHLTDERVANPMMRASLLHMSWYGVAGSDKNTAYKYTVYTANRVVVSAFLDHDGSRAGRLGYDLGCSIG